MRRQAKIIQINGFRGILTAIFVATCLCAGFVLFPGFVAMKIWNFFSGNILPAINLLQGVLLWGIVAITYFIASKRYFSVSFARPKELSEEEMSALMERIRMQSNAKIINNVVLKNIDELKKEETNISESEKEEILNK